MARTYRLGVVGFAHMHVNTLIADFAELPNVEWVACADTVPEHPELVEVRNSRAWNLRQAREKTGIPKVYADYREMLSREKLDLVIVCSENARHAEVVEAVAAAGASAVVEKPMAVTLADALRMRRAVAAAGVELFVNWPSTWMPEVREIKALLERDAIGEVWQMKSRWGSLGPMSHGSTRPGPNGEPIEMTPTEKGATWWHRAGTGGGALMDYCCYGACLSRWYLGEPATAAFGMVANLASPYATADDNALIAVRFPRAMAILEATWSCLDHGAASGPILYGTTGTIVMDNRAPAGQRLTIARGRGVEPELVAPAPLPAGRESLAKELMRHLETGEPVHPTLDADFNLEAMAILDAGIRSGASGRLELVNDARWCVG